MIREAMTMDDIHLSRQILRAVAQGKLPRSFLDEIKTEHLLSRCPHCRAEVEAYEAELRSGTSSLRRFSLFVSALLERLASSTTSRELSRAERDLEKLLPLQPEERARRVERARGRFRGAALVKLLLEESRRCIPSRPEEAFHLADLARRVLNRSPQTPQFFDLYVMASASMANARRVGNDRRMADDLFTLARQVITEHGVTDPEVVARVDDLLGSLRKDQRRFVEAERLLKRAAAQFGLIEAADDAARALINLGSVYSVQNAMDRAIEVTRSALVLLGPESEPRLHLCGHFNLAAQLVHAGRFEEASAQLERDEELYRRFPEPWTELRLVWLRGDIAAGRGDLEAAERAYLATRDGFVAQGIGYDAAMVSLDLAVLYLREGRTADVRRIAEEMVPIFAAQDVHREALAALALFQEAARQDQLTVEKVREVTDYLRTARREPELRFRWKRRF
jgi:tetratricopeptide (TPR) repeat protein